MIEQVNLLSLTPATPRPRSATERGAVVMLEDRLSSSDLPAKSSGRLIFGAGDLSDPFVDWLFRSNVSSA